MKEGEAHGQTSRTSGHTSEPALQVICLGSGGGPSEDNVTGFLVRSTAAKWAKNSVLAVDAGSHLAAITRILADDFPLASEPTSKPPPRPRNGPGNGREIDSPSPGTAPVSVSDEESGLDSPASELEAPPTFTTLERGPFAGLPFPNESARANALHVVREHVSTYLITHPHLDHVSGFVINTAAFHNTSRPKRLAALPFTVNAIKTHIFNNIVWPNLTDEDGGVGLVTFQRLQEGGNIALGEGSGRGYIEVCDGLGVRGFKVSHGHCMRGPGHIHRGSNVNAPETPGIGIHRASTHHGSSQHPDPAADGREARSLSFSLPTQSAPGTPLFTGNTATDSGRSGAVAGGNHADQCVIDSTAYFIRTEYTPTTPTKEVLMFGDVEPDSISLSPRTAHVWAEAAPKIAAGILSGIFIECSYTNVQGDPVLYGHLAPRHLLAELQNLADMVREARREHEKEKEEARKGRKRKRASNGLNAGLSTTPLDTPPIQDAARKSSRTRSYNPITADDEIMTDYAPSPRGATGTHTPAHPSHPSAPAALNTSSVHSKAVLAAAFEAPLKGLKVVVMHVKDTMSDGPSVGEGILQELREGERAAAEKGKGLGCVFEVAKSGDSYWF
ncbi:elongation factor EF-1 gamma subunit [Kalmusia sp. IMI 367209]|nr:elongation factor EF-1 gamma subunit [Kalmusia sp. IMI 367209]